MCDFTCMYNIIIFAVTYFQIPEVAKLHCTKSTNVSLINFRTWSNLKLISVA